MNKTFLDTSALLHQTLHSDANYYISPLTLTELEKIKTSRESEDIKYKARESVRKILGSGNITVVMQDQRKIDKLLKKHNFLSDINDHRILCAAELLAIELGTDVIFMTNDAMQYLFALRMPHLLAAHPAEKPLMEEWAGWGRYYPEEKEMALLYSDPQMNILKCKTNEYA